MQTRCPALMLSAPGSHHGKTLVSAALARLHARQGRRVKVFKAGPDFLDPMILAQASGQPVHQLDLWLGGEAHCRQLLHSAARDADLVLVEGVMGLYDGSPSCADLAERCALPVALVIDAAGMAQTLGAVALGLAQTRRTLVFDGVLANSVASPRHEEMIRQGMPTTLRYLGGMRRDGRFALPERHLGLVQAREVVDIDARLDAAATALESTALVNLPPALEVAVTQPDTLPLALRGVRIGIARDVAFSFLYEANLALLRQMGAALTFFSPLEAAHLPAVDAVYLPGGYPELHLQALQDNASMKASLRAHHAQGKPIYAECGGMLYLLESLSDREGNRAAMAGLLSGRATMQPRLQGLGYQTAPMPGGPLRAHAFHHSRLDGAPVPCAHGERLHATSPGEPIFCAGRLTASYLHCYFPSNPIATAALFKP
jgi:cobyrinic acid a,c-diamide synthase